METVAGFMGPEYEIARVETSSEAMSYIYDSNQKIALIMVCLGQNVGQGIAFIKELHLQGVTNTVPVIAIGRDVTDRQIDDVYTNGAYDYLDLSLDLTRGAMRIKNTINAFMRLRAKEQKMAETDLLTGALTLPGLRRRFMELVAENPKDMVVVIYMDIKNFKMFNAVFGFDVGNYLLKYWCETIKKYSSDRDMLCRITGDQMVLVVPERGEEEHSNYFDRVLAEVQNPFADEFGDYKINIMTGVYYYYPTMERGETFDEIIGYAKHAQRTIKDHEESSYAIYDDEMWAQTQRKVELNGHLEAGIANGELMVYMQPQYNIITNEMIGAECLCRWQHETLGWVSPGEFIPALEESGKIYKCDQFVWETSCKYLRKWLDEGKRFSLSVNISRADIKYAEDLPTEFMNLLEKYDLEPDMLRIEITESACMDKTTPLNELLERFSELGFTVEMDDFGSGYSSLNMLHEVDVDIIKLDMGFLRDEDNSGKGGSIVNAMVKMAHVLGVRVLAEGVENKSQVDFLKNIGCLMVQGYYYSKPLSLEEFEKLAFSESKIAQIQEEFDKFQQFNIQELFDRNSSGFFIMNYCMGPAVLFENANHKFRPVVMNDKFCELIQWSRDAVESERNSIFGNFSEKNQKVLAGLIMKAYTGVQAKDYFYSVEMDKYIELSVRMISEEENQKLYFAEMADVTDQKKLEHKVNELVKKLQTMMEVPGLTICDYDVVNDELQVTFNRDDGTVMETNVAHFKENIANIGLIHKDFVESYREALEHTIATGLYNSALVRAMEESGQYHLCKFHFCPIVDDDGKVYRVVGRAEQIQEQESDSYFEGLPVGTFRYQADGEQKFDYVSKNLLRMLGFGSEREFRDFYKDSFLNFVHPEDLTRVLGEITEQTTTSKNDFCEYRVPLPNGDYKWVYDRGTLIVDEQGNRWFYVAISDVDEYRKNLTEV